MNILGKKSLYQHCWLLSCGGPSSENLIYCMQKNIHGFWNYKYISIPQPQPCINFCGISVFLWKPVLISFQWHLKNRFVAKKVLRVRHRTRYYF